MLRRRPVARLATTAVVAGTAAHMGAKSAQRSAAAAEPQQYEAAEPPMDPQIAKLQDLAALRDQGVLSEEEFTAAKAKLLGI
jgi:hypothetical protein